MYYTTAYYLVITKLTNLLQLLLLYCCAIIIYNDSIKKKKLKVTLDDFSIIYLYIPSKRLLLINIDIDITVCKKYLNC